MKNRSSVSFESYNDFRIRNQMEKIELRALFSFNVVSCDSIPHLVSRQYKHYILSPAIILDSEKKNAFQRNSSSHAQQL